MCEQGEPRLEKSTTEAHQASKLLRTPAKKAQGTCPVNASLVGKLLRSSHPQPTPLRGVHQQQIWMLQEAQQHGSSSELQRGCQQCVASSCPQHLLQLTTSRAASCLPLKRSHPCLPRCWVQREPQEMLSIRAAPVRFKLRRSPTGPQPFVLLRDSPGSGSASSWRHAKNVPGQELTKLCLPRRSHAAER